jgi:hypothetical protein
MYQLLRQRRKNHNIYLYLKEKTKTTRNGNIKKLITGQVTPTYEI